MDVWKNWVDLLASCTYDANTISVSFQGRMYHTTVSRTAAWLWSVAPTSLEFPSPELVWIPLLTQYCPCLVGVTHQQRLIAKPGLARPTLATRLGQSGSRRPLACLPCELSVKPKPVERVFVFVVINKNIKKRTKYAHKKKTAIHLFALFLGPNSPCTAPCFVGHKVRNQAM